MRAAHYGAWLNGASIGSGAVKPAAGTGGVALPGGRFAVEGWELLPVGRVAETGGVTEA